MPVYLFTMHSYRSWMPDNPRGYVRRGEGILQPDSDMARAYSHASIEEPHLFDSQQQYILLWIAWDCCQRRDWRLHGAAFEPSHVHLLVSWRDETRMSEVFRKTKNLMSRELGLHVIPKRKHWFSKYGSRQQVKDQAHFDHLMNAYLPKHKGLVWREGNNPPEPPT